jgi:RimJ/RimL family protein N-acetyltransferase
MSASPPDAIEQVIVHTRLEPAGRVCIRTVRPDDEPRMRGGIEALSQQSRYLRFFSAAPVPPDRVIERLVAVDGHRHLAWGGILIDHPDRPAIGAVHAIRDPDHHRRADFAVGILDAYHGQGLARMLTAVLLIHCRIEGIATMDAQVLAGNQAAISLLRSLGAERCGTAEGVSDYALDIAQALAVLRAEADPPGLAAVFAAFRDFL